MSRRKAIIFLLFIIAASCIYFLTFIKEPEPILGLSVSIEQPPSVTSRAQLEYNITLANTGNCNLNVSVADSLGFAWKGLLTSGESKILHASFVAPVGGMVENRVEAVGYYKGLNVSSSDTVSTKVVALFSLIDAIEQGIVSTEFRGTGYCAGDSIRLRIKCEVEFDVKIEIEPGWILINSGTGQNMIIAEDRTITVTPEAEVKITIEAYCLDMNRSNPSLEETLSFKSGPVAYDIEVVKLMKFVRTAPEARTSVSAVQVALWVLLGDVSKDEIPMRHSEGDIIDAKWLLEKIGTDVSKRRIFQEISERPTLTVEIIQHQLFEDKYETIHIMGEVENIGTNTLAWIAVKVVFYDDAGSVVWIESDYAMRYTLFPGERSPFDVRIWKKKIIDRGLNFTSYEVWPNSAEMTTYVPYRSFNVSNITVEPGDGELHVTGDVKNMGDLASTVKVIVSVYDGSDKLVGYGSFYQYDPKLEPSETITFEIKGSTNILTGIIDHWVIYIEA